MELASNRFSNQKNDSWCDPLTSAMQQLFARHDESRHVDRLDAIAGDAGDDGGGCGEGPDDSQRCRGGRRLQRSSSEGTSKFPSHPNHTIRLL